MKKMVLSIALLLVGAGLQAVQAQEDVALLGKARSDNPEAREELQKCFRAVSDDYEAYSQKCLERVQDKFPGEVEFEHAMRVDAIDVDLDKIGG